jgi:hypothetical protein
MPAVKPVTAVLADVALAITPEAGPDTFDHWYEIIAPPACHYRLGLHYLPEV